MIDKKLKLADARISELSGQIEQLEKRKNEARERIAEVKRKIPETMQALQEALVTGADYAAIDNERRELLAEKERHEMLIEGLNEKFETLENQLSESIEIRNARFRELVASWLRREGPLYNKAVDSVRTHLKRFVGVHRLCSDLGVQSIFQEVLGTGVNYLRQTKVVTIGNGFSLSDLSIDAQNAARRPGPELCEKLFSEVVGNA